MVIQQGDSCEITTQDFISKIETIAYVGIFSSFLTIVSTFVIIVFIFYKGIFSLRNVKPLLHLTIADFLLAYVWFSSNIDYIRSIKEHRSIYNKVSATNCFVWQVLAETMHLTTFGFTINYSVNVYIAMKERSEIGYVQTERSYLLHASSAFSAKVRKYAFFAFWVLPILSMLPILTYVDEEHICLCERCVILIDVPRLVRIGLFYQSYGFVLLACALVTSMLSVIVLYILTLRLFWRASPGYRTDRERDNFKNFQKRITSYVLVFVVCWLPALIISTMKSYETIYFRGESLKQIDIQRFFWLYLLQAILTPLQGFFNTIVYGWTRSSFTRATRPTIDAILTNPIDSEVEYSQSSLPPDPSDTVYDVMES